MTSGWGGAHIAAFGLTGSGKSVTGGLFDGGHKYKKRYCIRLMTNQPMQELHFYPSCCRPMKSSLCSNIALYHRFNPNELLSLEMTFTLRRATEEDLSALNAIELSAASIFERIPELADLKTFHSSPEQIQKWLSNGRIYVAEDLGIDVGFVAAVPMDNVIYIAEISTVAECQGKGVGSALLRAVTKWAREESALGKSKPRISLTTYREVPWNAPWYRKRGFKEVDAATIGPKHNAKMLYDKEERSLVRPGYTRCCMLWEE